MRKRANPKSSATGCNFSVATKALRNTPTRSEREYGRLVGRGAVYIAQGKLRSLNKPDQPDFFDEIARKAYRRWQTTEEKKDATETAGHNRLLIENGDPELEQVICALEQGWRNDGGRE
ncbi:MAG: hypothetical protein JSR99_15240 [Proteobacteria bacterium]|nr:hypothetical protein [Pseudomonadota bacterium]